MHFNENPRKLQLKGGCGVGEGVYGKGQATALSGGSSEHHSSSFLWRSPASFGYKLFPVFEEKH